MRYIILSLATLALLTSVVGCSGSDSQPETTSNQDDAQTAVADVQSAQEQQARQAQNEDQRQAEGQAIEDESERASAQSQPAATTQQAEQTAEDSEDSPLDPDTADLSQLIYWGPDDGFFGVLLPIPSSVQLLIDRLLDSESPAADKYIIDLAAFPNPFREQVMGYLLNRYGLAFRTIYEYEEIFQFDPTDSDTPAYLQFKQDLFAGSLEDISLFLDPDADRTIDAREVMWGGVNIDGIPPLEHPAQVFPDDAADWINDSDVVVGVEINGDARAYPIRIIAWHEMVNDTIGGIPVSLAYCTLCGSPILFDGRVGSEVYRFGTSGLLYRSNKLMYDRNTRTLWNQFSGKPAWGSLVGQDIRLEVLPVVVTTWGDWYSRHPDSTVLSIETGFMRDYGPGVAYDDYFNSPFTWFNVPVQDDRLAAKDDVFAVRVGEALTAYPIDLLAERVLVHNEVGGLSIVVVATADGEGGRAFEAGDIEFASADPVAGTLTDANGNTWTISEDALIGPEGAMLPRVGGHNAYWFAITNQTDNGQLWEG